MLTAIRYDGRKLVKFDCGWQNRRCKSGFKSFCGQRVDGIMMIDERNRMTKETWIRIRERHKTQERLGWDIRWIPNRRWLITYDFHEIWNLHNSLHALGITHTTISTKWQWLKLDSENFRIQKFVCLDCTCNFDIAKFVKPFDKL